MSEKFSFAKLNNENYFVWKYRMEMLLIKEGLWSAISIDKPEPVTPEWIKTDNEARAYISLLVADNQLNHVRSASTARIAWNQLKEYHERASLSNKVRIMREICSLKLSEGGDAELHISRMTELFAKLSALGEKLSDNWVVAMLLSSLPRSYDTLITALETRPENDLTISLVQSKLLEENQKKSKQLPSETALKSAAESRSFKKNFNTVECFFCKKKGHQKRDCRQYKDWLNKNPQKQVNTVQEQNFVFTTPHEKFSSEWIVDSGASCHISREKQSFVNLNVNARGQVMVGNGASISAEGRGECRIQFINEDNVPSSEILSDVYYIPKMTGNLLSVRQLAEKGYDLMFTSTGCEINKNGKNLAVADMRSGLYYLRTQDSINTAVNHKHNEHCIHSLHQKFGHRDPEAIRSMVSANMMDNLKLVECGIIQKCEVCLQGKFARLPFPKKSNSQSVAPGDLVHTDVCGPMRTGSASGKRYFVTFIDDYSRYCFVYFLKNKSEVYDKLKEFVAMFRTQFGSTPKVIRSDRGGEYTGHEVTSFLKGEGIRMQYTAAYSPQQNGVAERKNRSLMEMARCMIIDADMDYKFWAEAVSTANFMQNRLKSRAVDSTPYQLWTGIKPNASIFKTFGSKVYVHIPHEKRHKLENTSELMTFVGYDEQTKAYRIVDKKSCKIKISRDVKFVDHVEEENIIKEEIADDEVEIPIKRSNPQATIHQEGRDTHGQVDEGSSNEEFEDASDFDGSQGVEDADAHRGGEEPRKSTRSNKGVPPKRLLDEIRVAHQEDKEPSNLKEALASKEKEFWKKAMIEEMKSLNANNTWELKELPAGRKAIGCRWVFKRKIGIGNNTVCYKARLVAQGFSQKYGEDYDEVFAPVVRHTTLRTLLAVASKRKYVVHHFDAKTAFLNGKLQEVIYMKQPPGFEDESKKVCLLKKSLYGLKQSARAWNLTIHEALSNGNFIQSKADPCLYHRSVQDEKVYVLVYVDDLVVASESEKLIKETADHLNSSFELKCLGPIKQYLGLEIEKDIRGNFMVSQTEYINKVISDAGLTNSKKSPYPLDPSYRKSTVEAELLLDNRRYQQVIGSLLYISVNSRPDISASVSILARRVSKPTQEDWTELKRVIKYLKGTSKLKLKLSFVEENQDIFYGYADADWAENRDDRKSNSGYVFKVFGGVVSWCCRKQTCVALSSTEAEFIALTEACQEAMWIKSLLQDFNIEVQKPTIFEDNQSCLKLISSNKFSNRTKHIETKYHFVKDCVNKNMFDFQYCPTDEMIADLLTKPLSSKRIQVLREHCGIVAFE